MKQKTPGLTLEPFDQDTFQRVWRRVIPDQDLSPIQPTVPAFSPASPRPPGNPPPPSRSEERRGGEEGRSRGAP